MRSRHKIIPTNIKGFCEFGLEAVTLFHRILCSKKHYSAFNFPTIRRHRMGPCFTGVRLVSGVAAVSPRLPPALKWKFISGHMWCDHRLWPPHLNNVWSFFFFSSAWVWRWIYCTVFTFYQTWYASCCTPKPYKETLWFECTKAASWRTFLALQAATWQGFLHQFINKSRLVIDTALAFSHVELSTLHSKAVKTGARPDSHTSCKDQVMWDLSPRMHNWK